MESHKQRRTAVGFRWWALAVTVLALDYITKLIVHTQMPYGQVIPLGPFFNVVHVWNTGAAFSFLADAGGWQRYFFVALALGVSLWLCVSLTKPMPALQAVGYSLILGGALGNAIDRIVRGYVVDFLDLYWRDWHWPAFNFADVGIMCGAALIVATTFRDTKAGISEPGVGD